MAPINKIVYSTIVLMMATSALAAPVGNAPRQIGGEATALYGIVNNVDNGSGYAVENLEDGIANGLNPGSGGNTEYGYGGDGGSSTGGGPAPPPRMARVRRQGNKIVNGLGPVLGDLGQGGIGDAVEGTGDQEDETLTNDAGSIGTTVGNLEEDSLSSAGYGAGEIAGDLIQEGKGAAPKGGAPAVPGARL
jgi:hypothetical protein